MAAATLRNYLVDERHRIRLRELVMREVETLCESVANEYPSVDHSVPDSLQKLLSRYEAATEMVLTLIINGCYWGDQQHEEIWINSLQRVASCYEDRPRHRGADFALYPALILLYGAGIAALAGDRYTAFAALLTKAHYLEKGREWPIALYLYPGAVLGSEYGHLLEGLAGSVTPLNGYLYNKLRQSVREFLPRETQYEEYFDRFEYLSALVFADLSEKAGKGITGPPGRFSWRYTRRDMGPSIQGKIDLELKNGGKVEALCKSGLFNGSLDRFQLIKTAFDEEQANMKRSWLPPTFHGIG